MKKLIAASLLLITFGASAQTLFKYGNQSVSVDEFVRAYKKNNAGPKTDKAFREYLDLYIASRLKIAEAREKGYDSLPQLMSDLDNLRQQILPTYLTDKTAMNKLVDEAFTRSAKDIRISHIFINGADQQVAKTKLAAAEADLRAGKSFEEVARKYSDDPSAKNNGGDLGYITVFTLPYSLENLAYTTPLGKVSAPFASKAGYHIFKNTGERKSLGRMKASQILLAFPPDASEAARANVKQLADSLYNRIMKGDDFGKLAARFSNDVVTAASNGRMQEFGTGDYSEAFLKEAFALPTDNSISKPFLTEHGYHIVRRDGRFPISMLRTEKARTDMEERVAASDRINTTKTLLVKKIMKETNYKKLLTDDAALWSYSDSVLNFQHTASHKGFTGSTPLITFGNTTYTSGDWIGYAQSFRYKSDGSGLKPYPVLWNEFVEAKALEYYQKNLEKYNPDFARQLNEFRDGNLFFEIMQRQVWGPAQSDSVALASYYAKHHDSYKWTQSADAVLFYASDLASANTFIDKLKKAPSNWRALTDEMNEKIAADSSRFELAQIPNAKAPLAEGTITTPLVNKNDNTASMALILKYYPQPAARNFAEAKGLVITDYQNQLEKEWLATLRKKYPVTINESSLKLALAKSKK